MLSGSIFDTKHGPVFSANQHITLLALSNHAYIPLDQACLLHQARKDGFAVTRDVSRLVRILGGPAADLITNIDVMRSFIDLLWAECKDDLKVKKLASECFSSITRGRQEGQQEILAYFLRQVQERRGTLSQHTLSWLVGHSIRMSGFDDLLQALRR